MHAQLLESGGFFEAAERKFYELTTTLKSSHTTGMEFSDIEKLIEKDGR